MFKWPVELMQSDSSARLAALHRPPENILLYFFVSKLPTGP